MVRDGFAYPTDDLACHRLAVFQPASSASGALMGGDAAALGELGMGDGDGDDNRSTSDLAGLATMAGLQVQAAGAGARRNLAGGWPSAHFSWLVTQHSTRLARTHQ